MQSAVNRNNLGWRCYSTTPAIQYSHEQRVSSPISLEQEGNTSKATMPKDTLTGSGVGTPDLVALLKFMQDQEAMRRREEEAREQSRRSMRLLGTRNGDEEARIGGEKAAADRHSRGSPTCCRDPPGGGA